MIDLLARKCLCSYCLYKVCEGVKCILLPIESDNTFGFNLIMNINKIMTIIATIDDIIRKNSGIT